MSSARRTRLDRWLAAAATAGMFAFLVAPLRAQAPTRIAGLGSLHFPNSGAPAAQHDFLRGVLLLHSFEYEDAAAAFRAARTIDPTFSLAYWGEAMTYTHPVWNEKDTDAALAVLAKAPVAPTSRERAYVAAVRVLYGPGSKATQDTLYALEMEKLAADYPEDLEAKTFYALALLGLNQGDRDVPRYMEAGAVALQAFQVNPDHPGAAHYTIHAFDDPTHAILAMPAARAYAGIAPDAAHAQHMTTHIFLARGMWDDVVSANLRAVSVTNRALATEGIPPTSCGHYNEWLLYGYQQQGRYRDAATLLRNCAEQTRDMRYPAGMRRGGARSYAFMRSLYLADTKDWDGDAAHTAMDAGEARATVRLVHAWGSAVAALHRGDRAGAERTLQSMRDKAVASDGDWESPYVQVWVGTLEALLLADQGHTDDALRSARQAAEYEASLPVDFGPPIAFKPARELEGELLLAMGRAEDAMRAFRLALSRTPNRVRSLVGYARAAVAAGRRDVAADAYSVLAELLREADTGLAEALEARTFLSGGVGQHQP